MRQAFLKTMEELAKDERIVFLTADLGFMALESLREKIPKRFFNVGVCEQNMVGMATGLAQQGLLPFCYSIIPFSVYRPFELIRNACYQNLPIRIIGMGAGFDYGYAGYTHFGLEDIGVLRTIPNLKIYSPIDSVQASEILRDTYADNCPIYYRLSKDHSVSDVYWSSDYITYIQRSNDLYVTTGDISKFVLKKAEEDGVSVLLVAQLNSIPASRLQGFQTITVFEAHVANGGLGTLIAEEMARHQIGATLIKNCAETNIIGSKKSLEQACNLG